jgi:hypothetical protein
MAILAAIINMVVAILNLATPIVVTN